MRMLSIFYWLLFLLSFPLYLSLSVCMCEFVRILSIFDWLDWRLWCGLMTAVGDSLPTETDEKELLEGEEEDEDVDISTVIPNCLFTTFVYIQFPHYHKKITYLPSSTLLVYSWIFS